MTRIMLAAGVAALAIAAPAASKPGGNDHSQQFRGGGRANVDVRARGGDRQLRASARVPESRAVRMAAFDRPHGRDASRAEVRNRNEAVRNAREARRGQIERRSELVRRDREVRNQQLDRRNELVRNVREARREQLARRAEMLRRNREMAREVDRGHLRDRARLLAERDDNRFDNRGPVGFGVGGCPPGLAKKAVACMPPGQARQLLGARAADVRRISALNELPVRLRSLYRDTPDYYYRYGDGYAYRVNRTNDVVSALLPLFGLGYGIGQPFPAGFTNYGMPSAYQPFYPSSPYADYRFANGYVYQVDPYTGLIQDVDPMLGYGYGYGQMMPAAYSAYNVPYDYRPLYYDTADSYYRYAPGAIYQVDPQTSLITAVAALLSPGLNVGQPLPLGYSAYNVPLAYRGTYYDSPDAMYRYANGNIYRIDPATQLVTALVASILT